MIHIDLEIFNSILKYLLHPDSMLIGSIDPSCKPGPGEINWGNSIRNNWSKISTVELTVLRLNLRYGAMVKTVDSSVSRSRRHVSDSYPSHSHGCVQLSIGNRYIVQWSY